MDELSTAAMGRADEPIDIKPAMHGRHIYAHVARMFATILLWGAVIGYCTVQRNIRKYRNVEMASRDEDGESV